MSKSHKANVFLFISYIILMTVFMISQGVGITPDRYVLMLFLGSLLIKKTRSFLFDWFPFIFLLISYDFLRSLAEKGGAKVHFTEMIWFDQKLFGQLPTTFLQQHFFNSDNLAWYDFLATFFYFLHFALPLAFAFVLWLKNKKYFKSFTNNLIVISYAAFITYVLFPAAPPWLAAQKGVIPGVTKILDFTLKTFPDKLHLPSIYNSFNPNTVAAIPSLHAAYPLLVFFLATQLYGKKALFFVPYVLGVWISIVYLGEHYVVDILLGVIYTVGIFYIVNKFTSSIKPVLVYRFIKNIIYVKLRTK